MTKDELLHKLSSYCEEDLEVALRAANANQQAQTSGLYFLHHFLGEERVVNGDGMGIQIAVDNLVKNPAKMVHGGVTAFLCDDAMGVASYLEKQRPGVTLDLAVRYHRPGMGKMLSAIGEVVAASSQINSTRCEVRDEHNTLIATATASFYHRRASK